MSPARNIRRTFSLRLRGGHEDDQHLLSPGADLAPSTPQRWGVAGVVDVSNAAHAPPTGESTAEAAARRRRWDGEFIEKFKESKGEKVPHTVGGAREDESVRKRDGDHDWIEWAERIDGEWSRQ